MPKAEVVDACLLPDLEKTRREPPGVPVRLCVIDLGTNSFHAVIVDVHPNGTFDVIDRMKEMVRLGEGGFERHRLTDAAMERGVDALRRLRLLADGWKVQEYLAYATSAIREAENGGDFIVRARKEVGIYVRPISGELEAELIYRGVRRAMDLPRPALLLDIGGGSTECIVHDGHDAVFQRSLKLGAARMTELFVRTDPVAPEEFSRLRSHYRSVLRPVFEAARDAGVEEIIGSSGTMENVATFARRAAWLVALTETASERLSASNAAARATAATSLACSGSSSRCRSRRSARADSSASRWWTRRARSDSLARSNAASHMPRSTSPSVWAALACMNAETDAPTDAFPLVSFPGSSWSAATDPTPTTARVTATKATAARTVRCLIVRPLLTRRIKDAWPFAPFRPFKPRISTS